MTREITRRHIPYQRFKAFLVENNVNQGELAEMLGKSKSALNQNLNGTGGDFSLREVRVICTHYKISADAYFLHPEVSIKKQNEGGFYDAGSECTALHSYSR